MNDYIERVIDLLDPALNNIHNMTVEAARDRVLSGKPESVREIDGSFALLARDGKTVRLARSVERQPDDVAKIVTAVAVSRLGEGVGQLPLLRFVAPLCCGVRDDVVRLALRADGCGASPLPAKDHARLLVRTKWIEK